MGFLAALLLAVLCASAAGSDASLYLGRKELTAGTRPEEVSLPGAEQGSISRGLLQKTDQPMVLIMGTWVCLDIPGYSWTPGVGHENDTLQAITEGKGANDLEGITAYLTKVSDACNKSCSCKAFNNDGELKADAVINQLQTPTTPMWTCFYRRDNPVDCSTDTGTGTSTGTGNNTGTDTDTGNGTDTGTGMGNGTDTGTGVIMELLGTWQCLPFTGFTWTPGVDHKGDVLQTITEGKTGPNESGIEEYLLTLSSACLNNCSCVAFNTDGELKSNSTIDKLQTQQTQEYSCFYTRDDPIVCTPPEYLYGRRVQLTSRAVLNDLNQSMCLNAQEEGATLFDNCVKRFNTPLGDLLGVIKVNVTGVNYVTIRDAASDARGKRCLTFTTLTTGIEATFTPCLNDTDAKATQQQFALYPRLNGGFNIVNRFSSKCLYGNVTDNKLIQTDCQGVEANAFDFVLEDDCPSLPGYVSFPGVDVYGDASTNLQAVGPIGPRGTVKNLTDVAAACNADCRCNSLTSWGQPKSNIADPTDVAGWNNCYYRRIATVSCCPDVPGYDKTVGLSRTTGALSTVTLPSLPPAQPITAANLATAIAACKADCQCKAFDTTGQLLSDNTVPNPPAAGGSFVAAPLNTCLYTAQAPSDCLSAVDPALFGARVRFQSRVYLDGCVETLGGALGDTVGLKVGVARDAVCKYDKNSAFRLNSDGTGLVTIREEASGLGRCLQFGLVLDPVKVATCTGAANQKFLFRKQADGRYQISAGGVSDNCIATGSTDNLYLQSSGCVDASALPSEIDTQAFNVTIEEVCPQIQGYDAVPAGRSRVDKQDILRFARQQSRASMAAECDADCKCMAFNSVKGLYGPLRTSRDYPSVTSGVNECYYIKTTPDYCACPNITGFNVVRGRDRNTPGEIIDTITPLPTLAELGNLCQADCTCNSFNSDGVLRTGTLSTVATADPTTCFYSIKAPTPCNVKCPATNLDCITSRFPALSLPNFSDKLPSIPIPGFPGDDLFKLLNPATMVDYVAKKQQGKALGDIASRIQCPGAFLPIFTGTTIRGAGFLNTLGGGACARVKPLEENSYIVGAISTQALDFVSSLGKDKSDKAKASKSNGKDYGICVAIDPCSLDFHLGFVGLSARIQLGVGPLGPPTLKVDLKSISFSKSGEGAILDETNQGLWTYGLGVAEKPEPVSIVGNLFLALDAELTWGFQQGANKIATITIKSEIEALVRFSNPTRFALQVTASPELELYNGFLIDFKKMGAALTVKLLFYVEHYDDNNFNVYVGVNINVKLPALLQALAGPFGDVLSKMISSDSQLNLDLNVHINATGGGVRLLLSGQVGLAEPLAKVIKVFAPNVPTSFKSGLGAKLSIVTIKGKKKVFGAVYINGQEFSYAFCSDSTDCMDDQTCYAGVCAKQVACLATTSRSIKGTLAESGVCANNNGYTIGPTCFKSCGSGYSAGMLGRVSEYCYADCPGGCKGLELFTGATCQKYQKSNFNCFFGSCKPTCDFFSSTKRDVKKRTEPAVCPKGTTNDNLLCAEPCPTGYQPSTLPGTCEIIKCPAKYPEKCSNPFFVSCVEKGSTCGFDKTAKSVFKTC